MRAVGLVGEVAIGWGLGAPPQVLTAFDPLTWADGAAASTDGHAAGPLVASVVRPLERLTLGPVSVPLAINTYTGGPPDWPAWLAWRLTGSLGAVTAIHVALGGLLILLVHRFVRLHGGGVAAGVAALLLATDWSFVFYKKVLGGTEVLLQAAVLLCVWALWSRRWAGGRHGLTALGVGIGLGLLAKSTFGISLVALALAALITRWDRPALRPPLPADLWKPVAAVVVLTAPLWIAALHRGLAPDLVPVPSHDFGALQWRRVWTALTLGRTPAREGLGNGLLWAANPLGFLEVAYGVAAPGSSPLRLAGWALVAGGGIVAWRDRHPTPREALLRFCTVFLLLQVGLLLAVARDLHHLAQATPTLAIVAGLALDSLAGTVTPPRGFARARLAALLALPWMLAGGSTLARTDAVVNRVSAPTFTASGQESLVALIRRNDVRRLVAADYELYGVLELRAPEVLVEHGWAAFAHARGAAAAPLLAHAAGGHLLVVQASAPMVYNLRASPRRLDEAAGEAGVTLTEVDRLPGGGAVLYAVSAGRGPD